jgi:hypothetical protein
MKQALELPAPLLRITLPKRRSKPVFPPSYTYSNAIITSVAAAPL